MMDDGERVCDRAKRMECVELAPAVGGLTRESGSKLHALHTLRAVRSQLCRPASLVIRPSILVLIDKLQNLRCGWGCAGGRSGPAPHDSTGSPGRASAGSCRSDR